MRHRNWGRKLSRNTEHRRALLRNLVTSLLLSDGQIKTTVAKAKAARPLAERVITWGKRGDEHSRRLAASFLLPGFRRVEGKRQSALKRLFDDVAPRFADRKGGYTRIVRVGWRQGDGAELALLQLVGTDIVEKRAEKLAKKAETRRKRAEEADAKAKKEAEQLPPEEGEKS
jgi:large subunit ribosomal protein L17